MSTMSPGCLRSRGASPTG